MLISTSPSAGAVQPIRDMPEVEDEAEGASPGPGEPQRALVDLLYRDHAPGLQRRLRARLGSSEEASDLVHEAFARLLGARATERLREPGAFLNRIVRNLLIDRARRSAARPLHVPILPGLALAVPPDQGEAIELEQMRSRYREAVGSLPPRTREVFVLHRIEGVGYKEIAARLDISVRTVEWHIAQAIVRIGRGLDRE